VLIKNYALASMIRRMDPNAEIFGPAMWGYAEMYSLWAVYNGQLIQPHDWGTYNIEPWTTNNTGDRYRYNGMTWMNAYLSGMKSASDGEGRRMLDVFSFHYYPDAGAVATDELRMQAPRSLWDPTYVEPSWITQPGNGFTDGRSLELLPKVRRSIDDFYPGTKIGITEYSFGGRHSVAGGIAQADALGIFGRQGVHLATCFETIDDYIAAAFRIYRNYDGQNSTFGDSALATTISNVERGSAYSSIDDMGRIHLVVINKENSTVEGRIAIASAATWNRAEAYGFGEGSPVIRKLEDPVFQEDGLTYMLAPRSVTHIVIMKGMGSAAREEASRNGAGMQVVPNPIIESGTIRVTLPAAGDVTVKLYDMLGNETGTIARGWRSAGEHDLPIDAAGLAAGSYTIRLEGRGFRLNAPLIITR
jgi:mannan endo-1,4-beta-mannosidase